MDTREIERDYGKLGKKRSVIANQGGDFPLGINPRVVVEFGRSRASRLLNRERLADLSEQSMYAN